MKTYHYCVVWHSDGDMQRHWSHGVVAFDGDLLQAGGYGALCEKIAAHMKPPHPGSEIVVHSLSLIADDTQKLQPAARSALPIDLMRF